MTGASALTGRIRFDEGGTNPIIKTLTSIKDFHIRGGPPASAKDFIQRLGYHRQDDEEFEPEDVTSAKNKTIRTGRSITPHPQKFQFSLKHQTHAEYLEWLGIKTRSKSTGLPILWDDEFLFIEETNPRVRAKKGPFINQNLNGMDYFYGVFQFDIIFPTFVTAPMKFNDDVTQRLYLVEFEAKERLPYLGLTGDVA